MNTGSYESNTLLEQYLLFHYGDPVDQLPWSQGPVDALGFPVRTVREGVAGEILKGALAAGRALDVGCSVGRSSFELGSLFEEVIGIDYSHAFVEAARTIACDGAMPFRIQETGTIVREAVATRPPGVTGSVSFEQGDAQDLRQDLGSFDCVHAANLLCRLARPVDFLNRLPELVNPGGRLVITTPNTWLSSFTAPEYWLGATPETGEPLEALKTHLEASFKLEQVWDMPFIIREHRRKFQWSVAQASRWIRSD